MVKKKGFELSKEDYRAYQLKREAPRGAFASIWAPDNSPRSIHKCKPADTAVERASKGQPKEEKEPLFLK